MSNTLLTTWLILPVQIQYRQWRRVLLSQTSELREQSPEISWRRERSRQLLGGQRSPWWTEICRQCSCRWTWWGGKHQGIWRWSRWGDSRVWTMYPIAESDREPSPSRGKWCNHSNCWVSQWHAPPLSETKKRCSWRRSEPGWVRIQWDWWCPTTRTCPPPDTTCTRSRKSQLAPQFATVP